MLRFTRSSEARIGDAAWNVTASRLAEKLCGSDSLRMSFGLDLSSAEGAVFSSRGRKAVDSKPGMNQGPKGRHWFTL